MAFPQEFIDNIKESIDIVDLVSRYTDLKKSGPNVYTGLCPHPDHADHDPSFRVWPKSNSWACMVCHAGKKRDHTDKNKKIVNAEKNYGSDCIAFIQWIENLPWRQAVLKLAEMYHIPVPSDENEAMYKANKLTAECLLHNLYGESFDYLVNRGLTIQDCDEWMIGFDGKKITFPLFDRYKNILGFTRRWLHPPEGTKDKYRNSVTSKIFNKNRYFYGIHNLDREFPEMRITEGSMDVILANKYGAKNVVATLGTAFTEEHIEAVKHYRVTPVFLMDGDEAGRKSINRAIELLAEHNIYSKVLLIPDGMDLADLSLKYKEGIEDYIQKNSITYGTYLLNTMLSSYISKLTELKMDYIPEIKRIINFVPSEDERIALKSFLSNNMGIDI